MSKAKPAPATRRTTQTASAAATKAAVKKPAGAEKVVVRTAVASTRTAAARPATAGIVSFEHEWEMFGLYRALLPLVADEAARRLIYDYLAPLLLWCSPALQWLDPYVATMHGWPIRLPSIGGDFVVMPSLAAPRVHPAVASPFLSPEALALHAVFIRHEQSLIHKVPPVPLRMLRGGYITRVPHASDELCTGPSSSRPWVARPPQCVRSVRNVCASCRICCEYYQILLCENHSDSGPNSPQANSDGKPTAKHSNIL